MEISDRKFPSVSDFSKLVALETVEERRRREKVKNDDDDADGRRAAAW